MCRQVWANSQDTQLIEVLLNLCVHQLDRRMTLLIVNNVWKNPHIADNMRQHTLSRIRLCQDFLYQIAPVGEGSWRIRDCRMGHFACSCLWDGQRNKSEDQEIATTKIMYAQSGLFWPILLIFIIFGYFLKFLSLAEHLGIEYGNGICRGRH